MGTGEMNLNSTDTESVVEAFWTEHLVPAGEATVASESAMLKSFDSKSTFEPPHEGPSLFSLEFDDVGGVLEELWQEHPALLEGVKPLVELSKQISSQQLEDEAKEGADVNPFMYVMF